MTIRFDRASLRDADRREEILQLLESTLEAISPERVLQGQVKREGSRLSIGERIYPLTDRKVFLLGVGKASAAMAQAMEPILGDRLTAGVVVTRYGCAVPTETVRVCEGGHPIPDENGLLGAQALCRLAKEAREEDLVLCLISGGGSALLPIPAWGLSLEDLQAVTQALLGCGAAIEAVNTVRRHLSAVQGGQLARKIDPAKTVSLFLSDVVGNALEAIASGPTVPDPTTFADARTVLKRFSLWEKVPASVRRHIEAGVQGEIPETPKPGDPVFKNAQTVVLADNEAATEAMRRAGERRGYRVQCLSDAVSGEARDVGRSLGRIARDVAPSTQDRTLIVAGGETTVTLDRSGKGGRNQEVALSAALRLEGVPNVMVITLATDGSDGPTDAAGAIVDGETLARARALGLDPEKALREHSTYPLLRRVGDLLFTGPTRTNVADLFAIVRAPLRE
jgi:hydroxypyruvate reductase